MTTTGPVALIAGVTGQDGAYLARFLLGKGYVVHGTSRDAALARLDGLVALGIADKVALHSMTPADFQSVARVIEGAFSRQKEEKKTGKIPVNRRPARGSLDERDRKVPDHGLDR